MKRPLIGALSLLFLVTAPVAPAFAQAISAPDEETRILQREIDPTLTVRARGTAPAKTRVTVRYTLTRSAEAKEAAAAALDEAIAAIKAAPGEVRVESIIRDADQTAPIFAPRAPDPNQEAAPAKLRWTARANLRLDAPSRNAVNAWVTRFGQRAAPGEAPVFNPPPNFTERADDEDPAWGVATRAALAKAEAQAKDAAAAANVQLGPMLRLFVDREAVVEGQVNVRVSVEYAMRGDWSEPKTR
jgi:hypothetical protein